MNRHHTGSGRRRMVPADWGKHHAAVVATSRNATVTLTAPVAPGAGWDADDEITTVPPATPYATDVTARIQALINRSDNDAESAEETIAVPPYLVAIDWGHDDVVEGTVVDVTACSDPRLTGRTLRVDHIVLGTERFERDLFCTLLDLPPTST